MILIWTMCDGKHEEKEIAEEFCSKLGDKVPKEEVDKAVKDIINQLEKFDLLSKAKGLEKPPKKKPAKKKGGK